LRYAQTSHRLVALIVPANSAAAALTRSGRSVVAGATAALLNPHEASANSTLTEYFSVLATGEALFVTFYSHVVANHEILGLNGEALNALEAILTEEQIHFNFAVANGGAPATIASRTAKKPSRTAAPSWQPSS
jgi:hypothetical protein